MEDPERRMASRVDLEANEIILNIKLFILCRPYFNLAE